MTMRRKFWILSIANWLLAAVVWAISAYLGIAYPTSLFLPTTLFVIGLFAAVVGILCWVAARFGREPEPATAPGPATSSAESAVAPEPAASGVVTFAANEAIAPSSDEPGPSSGEPEPAEAG